MKEESKDGNEFFFTELKALRERETKPYPTVERRKEGMEMRALERNHHGDAAVYKGEEIGERGIAQARQLNRHTAFCSLHLRVIHIRNKKRMSKIWRGSIELMTIEANT